MTWTRVIRFRELAAAGAWSVERFGATPLPGGLPCPCRPLREVVTERRELVDPARPSHADLPYLGLEQIESKSGLLATAPRRGRELRSRSKVFHRGDLLYGRLRPTLNKVFLAQDPVAEGTCSNEFHVLVPDDTHVDPRWLRFALSRAPAQEWVQGRLSGATHPRLALEDLLACPIPLPPLPLQRELGDALDRQARELLDLRRRIAALPGQTDELVEQALARSARTAGPGESARRHLGAT